MRFPGPDSGDYKQVAMSLCSGFCIYYKHPGNTDAPNSGPPTGALVLLN